MHHPAAHAMEENRTKITVITSLIGCNHVVLLVNEALHLTAWAEELYIPCIKCDLVVDRLQHMFPYQANG